MGMKPNPILFDSPIHLVARLVMDPDAHCRPGGLHGGMMRDDIEEHPSVSPSRAISLDSGLGTVVAVREPQPIHEGIGLGGWIGPFYLFRPDKSESSRWLSGDMLRPENPATGPSDVAKPQQFSIVSIGMLEGLLVESVGPSIRCFHCMVPIHKIFVPGEIVWAERGGDVEDGDGIYHWQRHRRCSRTLERYGMES